MKAGLCVYLFWFVDLGNACLFTAGSPVERRQWSFVKLAKPSKQKKITVTAAETDSGSTFLGHGKKNSFVQQLSYNANVLLQMDYNKQIEIISLFKPHKHNI